MKDPKAIVQEFCDLMSARDPEALRPLLADDATYQNVGMPLVRGREAILDSLGQQFAAFPDSYAYETINIAADGAAVLTERLDYIRTPAGDLVGIPVMGTFVISGGRITRWTDYWDTALPAKFRAGEDTDQLVPARP